MHSIINTPINNDIYWINWHDQHIIPAKHKNITHQSIDPSLILCFPGVRGPSCSRLSRGFSPATLSHFFWGIPRCSQARWGVLPLQQVCPRVFSQIFPQDLWREVAWRDLYQMSEPPQLVPSKVRSNNSTQSSLQTSCMAEPIQSTEAIPAIPPTDTGLSHLWKKISLFL